MLISHQKKTYVVQNQGQAAPDKAKGRKNAIALIFIPLFAFMTISLFITSRPCAESREDHILIVVSLKNRPYLEAVDGFKQELDKKKHAHTLEVVFLEDLEIEDGRESLRLLNQPSKDCIVTVGPEATRFLWREKVSDQVARKVYTMVLNPQKIIPENMGACGIALNIPVHTQLFHISKAFPGLKRLGILYNEKQNGRLVQRAAQVAGGFNITIVPLKVTTMKDISQVLLNSWGRLDGLWLIPDRVAITESLVQFMIKEGLKHNVATFGYNQFFYHNGAAMAYVMDYHATGAKTVQLVQNKLKGLPCDSLLPVYKVWLNRRILYKLDFPYYKSQEDGIIEGP